MNLKEKMDEWEQFKLDPFYIIPDDFQKELPHTYRALMQALKEAVEMMGSIQIQNPGWCSSQMNKGVLPPQSILHPKAHDWLKKWGFYE